MFAVTHLETTCSSSSSSSSSNSSSSSSGGAGGIKTVTYAVNKAKNICDLTKN
jgi:exo-beta-1,3-glucanase (GH17 family)